MSVTAPPRPPRPDRSKEPLNREEIEALVEALIEEVRQETRRRRRRNWAVAALVTFVGVVVLVLLDGGAASQTVSPAVSARSSVPAVATSSKIAFTQSRAGGQESGGLYVMNANGSGKRRLANAGKGWTPSWSPDGRKIAFGARVVSADGSGLQRLTSGSFPAWSPDGRRIAFMRISGVRRSYVWDIYVMNADGGGERRLTSGAGGPPVWSPDGQKIAFASRQRLGLGSYSRNFEIYVMNADGSGRRHLARTSYDSDPVWSPDGRQIAYPREYDIWVMNADGTGQRRLTSGAGRDLSPAWSPDGQKIAFERRLGRRGTNWGGASSFDIYVMNADGNAQRSLARNGAHPLWSPDGRKIAFRRKVGGGVGLFPLDNWDIFVMNPEGSEQRNLTHNRRWDDAGFAWSPAQ